MMNTKTQEGFSIIICCYNSAERIGQTLRYLSNQIIKGCSWEIIIVDNCSLDNTQQKAIDEWRSCKVSNVELRVVQERSPGLSFARIKGVDCAKFNYILFCDDDNWLAPDYIETALDLFKQYSNAGAIGGEGVPVFENGVKPDWFEEFSVIYAVGKQADKEGIINKERGYLFGAGSVWKKSLLETIMSSPLILTDRIGNKLTSGGDSEMCYKAISYGYDIVYSPKLKFQHFIPTTRLNKDYVQKFLNDTASMGFYLHGLVFKIGIQESVFDNRFKRSWVGRVGEILWRLLREKRWFTKREIIQIETLVRLNFKYDKSFY